MNKLERFLIYSIAFVAVPLASTVTSLSQARAGQKDSKELTVTLTYDDGTDLRGSTALFRRILSNSTDIQFVPYPFEAESGTDMSSEQRVQKAFRLLRIDAALLLQQDNAGRLELAVYNSNIERVERVRVTSPINEKNAVDALQRLLSAAAPKLEKKARTPRDTSSESDDDSKEVSSHSLVQDGDQSGGNDDLRDEIASKYRAKYGSLRRYFSLRAGGLFGLRSMVQKETGSGHETGLIGGAASIDTVIALFERETVALGLTGRGAFAPFKSRVADSPEALSSNFKHFTADLHYLSGMSPNFVLDTSLGGSFTDIWIEKNKSYPGDFYVPLRIGFGGRWKLAGGNQFRFRGLVLPVLEAKHVDSLFSNGSIMPGVGLNLKYALGLTEHLELSANYELQYFNAGLTLNSGRNARIFNQADWMHLGTLSVGGKW